VPEAGQNAAWTVLVELPRRVAPLAAVAKGERPPRAAHALQGLACARREAGRLLGIDRLREERLADLAGLRGGEGRRGRALLEVERLVDVGQRIDERTFR